jgi:hypothetical protein
MIPFDPLHQFDLFHDGNTFESPQKFKIIRPDKNRLIAIGDARQP